MRDLIIQGFCFMFIYSVGKLATWTRDMIAIVIVLSLVNIAILFRLRVSMDRTWYIAGVVTVSQPFPGSLCGLFHLVRMQLRQRRKAKHSFIRNIQRAVYYVLACRVVLHIREQANTDSFPSEQITESLHFAQTVHRETDHAVIGVSEGVRA